MFKNALPGFRDFFPEELAERARITNAWRDVARRYAFVEYDGPPLEPLELYTRKSGEEIVGQLYNFTDKGGRDVALRPEMTPTVARMVASRVNTLRKPIRWFSTPQLYRYERQQRGRLREHYQLNVDIFGASEVAADAEVVCCAIDVMRALGLTSADVVVRVSDRRVLEAWLIAVGVPAELTAAVYQVIDKLDRTPKEVSVARLQALGVDARAIDRVTDIASLTLDAVRAELAGTEAVGLVDEFGRYHAYVSALLGGDDTWLKTDFSIVRGLAYYTGIVFELFDRSGEFRAICGGGRYDTLLQALGGVDIPGVGFGMGDVVLGEMLRSKGLLTAPVSKPDVWLIADEALPLPAVMAEAARRRAAGQSVEYALRPQSLNRQKKAAQASGAGELVTLSNDTQGDG